MSKQRAALLIGINYPGTSMELRGCVNDSRLIADTLKSGYGYTDSDITFMHDGAATRDGIMNALSELVAKARSGKLKEIWVSYSGHGTYLRDSTGDEVDGRDECLVPVDVDSAGLITDDELYSRFVSLIPKGVNCVCIMDCCHSGTLLDMSYRYVGRTRGRAIKVRGGSGVEGNIICLSGCRDNQLSQEAMFSRQEGDSGTRSEHIYGGALTLSMVYVLGESGYKLQYSRLLTGIKKVLKAGGFTQVPVLTTSKAVYGKDYFAHF